MPSVGSTPTATLPLIQRRPQQLTRQTLIPVAATATATITVKAPVAKRRLKLAQHQPVLPLQLQYQPYQPQQQQQQQSQQMQTLPLPPSSLPRPPSQTFPMLPRPPSQPQVTTTQPQPAGVFATHNNNVNHSYNNNNNNNSKSSSSSSSGSNNSNNNNNDMSPISSCNSISSADTNHTILNAIVKQKRERKRQTHSQSQSQTQSLSLPSQNGKYSQFMIITPAVSIDRDFESESHLDFEDFANAAQNNGNLYRAGPRRSDSSSDDSGNSSDNSFRSNYNPYVHHSRQHLLSKKSASSNSRGGGAQQFYSFSSWRWCTLLCAAMRCFGAGYANQAPYSTSFVPHHRLRRSSSCNGDIAYDYEHFAAPFKARKTRDHMNNITYEL